ncbi:oxidoreductase [Blautia sp. HCP3S3_H10_1]|uniref:oxidoreductase n=1 Tax=unclassified Blautia TaxID=2648079 RepID=UPI003F91A2F0|nr:FAD-dependent oxidoreductase [Clostridia bacterium]
MERKYPHLCQPITLGNVTFRNRMFASPIGATDIDKDCVPGNRTQAFYELRAKGGAAAVTMSELVVHPETDGSHMLHLDLATVGSLAAFTFTADAIKRHGAVPSVEFSHSGQYAGTYMADKNKKQGLTQYGPSDGVRPDGMKVTALTKEQIADIVKRYGETAILAKRAGFEMIMIHGGHTWLLNQFISPYFNHRTDEYGGSFENRMRFTIEVLKEVRNAVGPVFPIEFRMSGSELFEGGYDLDEGVRIAQAVEPYVDLIHVSAGSYQFGFFRTHPSMFAEHGVNVYLAEEIKKHVSKPVATIGALNDPAQMEEIIASGKADVVYMGRALLADPYLPQKVVSGNDDKIVKCLRCFACMAERPTTQTRRCTVNPLIGREIEGTEVLPAAVKKKVLVVGGGVAGLKAAVTAALRGHKVILCEKSDKVGGILKCEQAIDFKQEMYQLGLSLEAQAKEAGVEIRCNTEVTPEYAEAQKADVMILAVGSNPIVPSLKGMDGDNVVVVNNYYLEKEKVGDSVVVLGGGLAGCEAAIHLAQEGKKVHLVEMRPQLAPDANIRHRPILMQMIDKYVEAHTQYQGMEVTADGVICKDADGKEVLVPGKSVICAVGQRANRSVVDQLRDCAPVVREIGDCVRPSNITNAIYMGYHAGLDA